MEDGVELSGDVESGSGKENLEDEKKPLKTGSCDNPDSHFPDQENNKLDISSAKINGDREDIITTDKNDVTVLSETLPNVDQQPNLSSPGCDEPKVSSKEHDEKEKTKTSDDEDKKEDDSLYEPMTTRSKLAMLTSLTSSSELTIELVSKDTDKNNDAKNVKFDEMNTNEKVPKLEITLSKPKTRSQSVDSTTSVDKGKNLEIKAKSQKRKADTEDKSESNEKFPILYKGFKKKNVSTELSDKQDKKVNLKWNPFNPAAACKRDSKVAKSRHICDEIDSSSLQSEYAQYLGLQPILKFKCSNCGMSSFQSMSALNSHQIDCRKQDKSLLVPQMPVQLNPASEPKSANIKLTRKVFLCSACGTYYEHWDLFLHMREMHRRYICLFCLGMFSVADKLSEHLTQKHNVSKQEFQSVDDFTKCYQTFFLLCLVCDKVFSETDTFSDHSCEPKKNIESLEGSSITAKLENLANQNQTKISQDSHQSSMKSSGKRTRESAKKSFSQQKSLHLKKDTNGSNVFKAETTEASENATVGSLLPPETQPKTENELNEEIMPSTAEQPNTKSAVSDVEMKNVNETKFDSNQTNQEVSETNCHSVPAKSLKRVRKVKKVIKKPVRKKKLPITPPVVLPPVQEESPPIPSTVPTTESEPTAPMDQGEFLENECINNNEQVKDKVDVDDIEQDDNKMEVDVPQPQSQPMPKSPKVSQEFEFTNKLTIPKSLFKLKLQSNLDSDNESDDSQKLSLVVDEQASSATNSDNENSKDERNAEFKEKVNENSSSQGAMSLDDEPPKVCQNVNENVTNDIALAGEEVAVMALALDDKIDNISIQTVVKECVRTSCLNCNYCRHASKIAVNGKQLALHLLSEHRYMPTKNETTEDVINKLRHSLDKLSTMFFNSETYDSTDPSVYVPYDQELRFNCFQCNHESSSHKDLYAHKKKYHSKSLLLCIMCKSTFVSYSELICHLCPGMYSGEILNVDMKFRCCLCPLDTIPSGFRLMVHLRKSHHMCDICLEICQDQQKLSTHMWKHKLNHLCYRCGIAYASKPDITKHLFWKHGTESVLCKKCLQKKWPHVYHFCIPPTSFICEECNTSFSKAVALKVHKRIHGNDIPYACSQCEKKFVSRKLLKRHEERHNKKPVSKIDCKIESDLNEEDSKEEIINVTDLPNENQEPLDNKKNSVDDDENKENKPADGTVKKEKKNNSELDIPPLNLSSDSDSDDDDDDDCDESSVKPQNIQSEKDKEEDNIDSNKNTPVSEASLDNAKTNLNLESEVKVQDNLPEVDSVMPELKGVLDLPQPSENSMNEGLIDPVVNNAIDQNEKLLDIANLPFVNNFGEQLLVDPAQLVDNASNLLNTSVSTKVQDNQADEIWENFYKTNPQNSSLPYPLCAMKSEVAYGIIMGDHDYCQRSTKSEPLIKEELPSNLGPDLSDDKLEETTGIDSRQTNEVKEENPGPTDSPKKKPKSPKKRISKPSGENSSSSSSDSSDTDSSTCSCGTNCSCSSSSSSGSSSSSSDSESSGPEDSSKTKEARPKKRKERRSKTKTEIDPEGDKEHSSNAILPAATEPENVLEPQLIKSEDIKPEPQTEHKLEPDESEEANIIVDPEDPPIRESELETDETSSDEEFYDSQPQRKVSQLMAEKRNQLMQNAAALPSNNGNSSPSFTTEPLLNATLPMTPYPLTPPIEIPAPQTPTSMLTPKSRVRPKRNRKTVPKIKVPIEKPIQNSSPYPQQFMDIPKSFSPYHQPVLPESKPLTPIQKPLSSFMPSENTPGGSENDKSRSSKRRRIPNKFYGYSSGEEDEKPTFKWRKQDTPSHHKTTPPSQPILPPPPPPPPQPSTPTPRIQLTVPKHIIRKTPKATKIKVQTSSNDSSDSGSEDVKKSQFVRSIPVPPPPLPVPQPSHGSQKPDKDVYCYCRCPYDEVSEMIACDDENCTIEWFHFECVGIMVPPRGEWFCPGCRKARGLPPA